MRAPGITYAFTSPTDTAGPTLDVVNRHFQQSSADALIQFIIRDVPKDRIFILQNFSLLAAPGTGQGIFEMKIQGITRAGLNFTIATASPDPAATASFSLNGNPDVWIHGGGKGKDTLRVFGFFNGAVFANNFTVGISALIIPNGNVSVN